MLPENNTYGEWPLSGKFLKRSLKLLFWTCLDVISSISGEIDLMESRGNGPTYPAQYATCLFSFFLFRF
jgi:hypothetical protein